MKQLLIFLLTGFLTGITVVIIQSVFSLSLPQGLLAGGITGILFGWLVGQVISSGEDNK